MLVLPDITLRIALASAWAAAGRDKRNAGSADRRTSCLRSKGSDAKKRAFSVLSSAAAVPALPVIDAGSASLDNADDDDDDVTGAPAAVIVDGNWDEAETTFIPDDSNMESNERLIVGTEWTTGGTCTGAGRAGIRLENSELAREETASAVVVSSKDALRLLSVTSTCSTSCRN